MALTDTKIKSLKPKGKAYNVADSDGLYIEVRPSGSKFWRYRFWLSSSKDGRYTIGEYPFVSLSEARKERDWAKSIARKGLNPTTEKKNQQHQIELESKNTFMFIAEEWMEKKSITWKVGTKKQVREYLERDCFPAFGHKPIKEVTPNDILLVMKSMENRGSASTALKVRQWCSSIFCYAASTLRAESDPAALLKGAIITPNTTHSKNISNDNLKKYFDNLNKSRVYLQTKSALYLLPFLFVRQAELRNATWDEFDLDNNLWVIKKERMKMGRPHSVPLTDNITNEFIKLKTAFGENINGLVFPSIVNSKKSLSYTTLNRAITYLGFGSGELTCHDFRATASTRLYEAGFRTEVIEKQLAHAEQNRTIAAYNHAEYLDERRKMMEFWESELLSIIEG